MFLCDWQNYKKGKNLIILTHADIHYLVTVKVKIFIIFKMHVIIFRTCSLKQTEWTDFLKTVKKKVHSVNVYLNWSLCFSLCADMTMWKWEMEWMRAVSWSGSIVGRSLPLLWSPLGTSSSSSLCLTMRLMALASPSATRSSKQVSRKKKKVIGEYCISYNSPKVDFRDTTIVL